MPGFADFVKSAPGASMPSVQAQPGVSGDLIDKLIGQLSSSRHELSMPASMTQPIPDFKPLGMDDRQVVGKGNAKAQGIGNAITGVLSAIGSITTAEGQKKQLQIATDTQSLLKAQQGIDEAKDALKNNPQDPDAKAQLDHNNKVMNGILSDPKMRKAIGKGFAIDWTDPSGNNTDEHKGVAQGKKMAQHGIQSNGDYASQFGAALPKTNQVNPQTQAVLEAVQKQQELKQKQDRMFLDDVISQREYMARLKQSDVEITKESMHDQTLIDNTVREGQDRLKEVEVQATKAAELAGQKYKYDMAVAAYTGAQDR